jgi:MerR family mercuric resistance operon transcriptional regulator
VESLKIGQVARQTGLGVETIRFYERQGLIDEPPRRESGYREYPADVVVRIQFIKRAKELGFSLKEIRELLDFRMRPDTTCAELKQQVLVKIDDVSRKISDLERIHKALSNLAERCKGEGPKSDCPMLDALGETQNGG